MTNRVHPFDLENVKLHSSVFTENREREYKYLESLDIDRLLYSFRETAGMDTKDAKPLEGWMDPVGKLRGHSTGHYLSAISQAYASTGDEKWKNKIDYMVDELAKIQTAMPSRDNGMKGTKVGKKNPKLVWKNNEGFLSAYPERQFILLENGAEYKSGATDDTDIDSIWAPYYTLHKIMAGLLDAYELAGNEKALNVAKKNADWVEMRLSKLSQDKLDDMWERNIAGEYGGMNETLTKISKFTEDKKYTETAQKFDNNNLFPDMANNNDILDGLHANQHIPQIIGALSIFNQTNNEYYYDIAHNFWNMVVGHRTFSTGGTGEEEFFKERDKIAEILSSDDAENCASYNMLKLTRDLFFCNPDPTYMDYYEKTLYNAILSSQDQSDDNRGEVYFMPLGPGLQKEYGRDGFTCCAGTGLESQTKYQDSIYFYSNDGESLYVNMYIPSTLNWKDKGFVISQKTNFPLDESSIITVNGYGKLNIKLHVPYWVEEGFDVKINGVEQDVNVKPGTYVTLSRTWQKGDEINISFPYNFRLESTPDDPHTASIFYGPLLMVGKDNRSEFITLDLDKADLNKSFKSTEDPLHFETNNITFVPMYEAYNFQYHAYFKVSD